MEQQRSRIKMSFLNARVNFIFYFISLFLSFFSRKIFLSTLGDSFIGLISTLQSILGFLNLVELGVGAAIGYLLYKPLFDNDRQKVNDIITVLGYLYRRIGFIILILSVILAFFLPVIFPNKEFDLFTIYLVYFTFVFSSLFGYFFIYQQALFTADQKNYIIVSYNNITIIVKTIIQMLLAFYLKNYYLWIAMELLFTIIYSFMIYIKIKKEYPWLRKANNDNNILLKKYPEIIKNTKRIFIHRIGSFAQWQTLPFIINIFTSLQTVVLFVNYSMIVEKLNLFVNSVLGSTDAGVGNLIAEGNIDKIYKVYWESFTLRVYIAGVIVFGLLLTIDPFITLWLGSDYLLDRKILYVLVANIFINQINGTTSQFIFGYGLFQDTWVPVGQFIACVVFSVIGGIYAGLFGIVLGNTLSLFIFFFLWKPYFLFSCGFKLPIYKYILSLVRYLILLILSGVLVHYLFSFVSLKDDSFGSFIISALLPVTGYCVITFILFYIFIPSTKLFIQRFLNKKN